jgi:hypothetical protein
MTDSDLLTSCITREANINLYVHEPTFAVNSEPMRYPTGEALLRGIKDYHLALGIVVVAVLASSICARHAYSLSWLFFFKIW